MLPWETDLPNRPCVLSSQVTDSHHPHNPVIDKDPALFFLRARFGKQLADAGVRHRIDVVRYGDDAQSVGKIVCANAKNLGAAMVIMSNHNKSALEEMFIGSTSQFVTHVRCAQEPPGQPLPFVSLNGSLPSPSPPRSARRLRQNLKVPVVLVHYEDATYAQEAERVSATEADAAARRAQATAHAAAMQAAAASRQAAQAARSAQAHHQALSAAAAERAAQEAMQAARDAEMSIAQNPVAQSPNPVHHTASYTRDTEY